MIRFRRLFKSFVYAFRGLFRIFHEEQNLKIQTFAAAIVIILGLVVKIRPIEWCILILAMSSVILMETINSAAERISDVLRPRINSYVKEIKDITAAAVMVSSLVAAIIGLIIFYPYLFK